MKPVPGYEVVDVVYRDDRRMFARVLSEMDGRRCLIKTAAGPVSGVELALEYEEACRGDCPYFFTPIALRPEDRAIFFADEDVVPFRDAISDFGETAPDANKILDLAIQLADLMAELDGRGLVHPTLRMDGLLYAPCSGGIKLIDWSGMTHRQLFELGVAAGATGSPIGDPQNLQTLGVLLLELVGGCLPSEESGLPGGEQGSDRPAPAPDSDCGRRDLGGDDRGLSPDGPADRRDLEAPPVIRGLPPEFLRAVAALAGSGSAPCYRGAGEVAAALRLCRETAAGRRDGLVEPAGVPSFVLPEGMVGREGELRRVAEAYEFARNGGTRLVLVEGEPGVGKTSLIREFMARTVGYGAMMLVGKGEKFQEPQPYGALLSPCRRLLKHLLTLDDERLADWKEQLETLAEDGAILADWLPELRYLLAQPADRPQGVPNNARERLGPTLVRFLQLLASNHPPLVLFLDDLQWSDPEGVALVQALLNDPDSRGLLLIGACRTEGGPDDGAGPALTALRAAGASRDDTLYLPLSPLSVSEMTEWLSRALDRKESAVNALAAVLHEKTRGNPLESAQILKAAAEDGMIAFHPVRRRWEWRPELTERLLDREGAPAWMTERFDRMSPSVREILALASCMGFHFRVSWIAALRDKPPDDHRREIQEAVEAGFLLPVDGDGGEGPEYQFVHDRLRQMVDDRLTDAVRISLHHRIARMLEGEIREGGRDEHLFILAHHWRAAAPELSDEERIRAAGVHLEAGEKAKAAGAFEAAHRYFAEGTALLPEDAWESAYDLARDLEAAKGESAFLLGNAEEAEADLEDAFRRVHSRLEKLRILSLKMLMYYHVHDPAKTVEILHRAVELFGFSLPRKIRRGDLVRLGLLVKIWMKRRGHRMEDPDFRMDEERAMLLKLLLEGNGRVFDRGLHAYIMLWSFAFTLRYGRADASAYALSAYGMYLGAISNRHGRGTALGRTAVRWAAESGDSLMQASARFIYGGFLQHWHKPWMESVAYLQQAKRHFEENGEFFMAGTAAAFDFFARFQAGVSVDRLQLYLDDHADWMNRVHLEYVERFFRHACDLLTLLRRSDRAPEWQPLPETVEETAYMSYAGVWLCVSYILGESGPVPEDIERAVSAVDRTMITNAVPDLCFWHALRLCRRLGESRRDRDAWKIVRRHLARYRRWAGVNPGNFRSRYLLIMGEVARLRGRDGEALRYYEEAVQLAESAGLGREAAVGYELAGKHAAALGRGRLGEFFLARAYRAYVAWGAWAKAAGLRREYPDLTLWVRAAEGGPKAVGDRETGRAGNGPAVGVTGREPRSGGGRGAESEPSAVDAWGERGALNRGGGTDVAGSAPDPGRGPAEALLAAWRTGDGGAMWSELLCGAIAHLRDVLQARKLALIAERGSGLQLVGLFTSEDGPVWIEPGEAITEERVPVSLVRYVWRTGETVCGEDPASADLLSGDAHCIVGDRASVVCLPVQPGPEGKGILYVERVSDGERLTVENVHGARTLTVAFFLLHGLARASTASGAGGDVRTGGGAVRRKGIERATSAEKALTVPFTPLTGRELEVLALMAEGCSNQEIADLLGVAMSTAKVHVKNILGKLHANRRTQAIRRAQELRLIDPAAPRDSS